MQNTRKSGQILRSENRPRPTLRSGRGSRTNSNTSHQIPARVIEADSARAVWAPDPRLAQLIQPGAAAAVITVPSMAWACRPYHASYATRAERTNTLVLCRDREPFAADRDFL